MPELPEVETVRRGIAEWAGGRRISEVEVRHPRSVRHHLAGAKDFAHRLRGTTITGARRRGKFLWLPLDSGDALLCHLGMSGQLLVQPTAAPDETHLRIRVAFDDPDRQLRFVDQRIFGEMRICYDGAETPTEIDHIAADVYEPGFDAEECAAAIRTRRSEIKRVLLDQSVISGIGNIYADEALWKARMHGRESAFGMPSQRIVELLGHVRDTFDAALRAGGTSFDALYVNVNGQSGYFERSLAAYGREHLPCSRCDTPIAREKFAGRSSFYCPRCQEAP
ncbi:MAG TPA: bifunctional DNA-formamidopyrimidine glycosylase/DNA-(apurinic or apyrimidinic site) lyase [Stackebrandtia sp.]|uniref:bifunctional DNA-formamidopyrimidine glycosylase/DNA-(apurinic or apyrimidinic site) lyase n=1 Tax=Stackebrandtia sp. TaxID=2023065 RepID=UPI002D6C99FE|nr:bifunctional DNA-formamidopyrimidine glycosylase/DNA-(apurinic or apyrimidinic site) lyase [Stackebrandtia sp.]HZE41643.1 bifunctional DNA-formamidopyrimidine glycosylase/DNA-(apurinic or apyrimidinic site) lyase [Stackebrandtia sp.]